MLPASFLPSPEREDLMLKGIMQLETWLYDVIRIGLLQYDFSETSVHEISSRLVDAKLGGIARRVRRLSTFNRSDPGWFHDILTILGELYLLISAFKKKDQLSENTVTSIYILAGYTIQKSELTTLPSIPDQWMITGIEYSEEENLRSRSTWIMGLQSKRSALLLDFAFGRTEFDPKFDFNRSYEGKLVYYPGSFPLRASLFQPVAISKIKTFPGAFDGILKFLDVYAMAVSKNPWIRDFPASIKDVRLLRAGTNFLLQDGESQQMQLLNEPYGLWALYASLALQPCTIFGIWNGRKIKLLSVRDGSDHYQIEG